MLRYKAFSSAPFADDLAALEQAINAWLAADQPHIYLTSQSAFGAHLVVSFLYDTSDGASAKVATATAVPEVFERTLDGTELDPEEPEATLLPEAELPY